MSGSEIYEPIHLCRTTFYCYFAASP